jgi:hypothetical protein
MRFSRIFPLFIVLAGCATGVGQFEYINDMDKGGFINKGGYSVKVPSAGDTFDKLEWQLFESDSNSENIILNIGYGKHHSWAVSVFEDIYKNMYDFKNNYTEDQITKEGELSDSLECVTVSDHHNEEAEIGRKRFFQMITFCNVIGSNKTYLINVSQMNYLGIYPNGTNLSARPSGLL